MTRTFLRHAALSFGWNKLLFFLLLWVACNSQEESPPSCVPDPQCQLDPGTRPPGCVCTLTGFPVCGTDYKAYRNPGFARCACADILHEGTCLPSEGSPCTLADGGASCGIELYCRPGELRCTKKGVCVTDSDCPAGEAPSDGGAPPGRCIQHACVR